MCAGERVRWKLVSLCLCRVLEKLQTSSQFTEALSENCLSDRISTSYYNFPSMHFFLSSLPAADVATAIHCGLVLMKQYKNREKESGNRRWISPVSLPHTGTHTNSEIVFCN